MTSKKPRRYRKHCQSNLAVDNEPFFSQFYRMDGDPKFCGHELLLLLFDTDQAVLFAKVITWVKLNCFSATSVGSGYMSVVSLNNFMVVI